MGYLRKPIYKRKKEQIKYTILFPEKEQNIAKRYKIRYTAGCMRPACGEFETILT